MDVPGYVWLLTVVGIVAMLKFDFVFHVRRAHTPPLWEAAVYSSPYVGIAILFGLGVWVLGGRSMGTAYLAGCVTEKALSVDNLFVFFIIMTSFAVPRADQQKVLLFGIVFSLIARTGAIFIGAALIHQVAWMFYLFGLVLLSGTSTPSSPTSPSGRWAAPAGSGFSATWSAEAVRGPPAERGDQLVHSPGRHAEQVSGRHHRRQHPFRRLRLTWPYSAPHCRNQPPRFTDAEGLL